MVIACRQLAAALLTACTAAAHTHGTPRPNPNWAGYVATPAAGSPTFTSAAGAWRQPAPICHRRDGGAAAAVWVGIGGFDAGTDELQQIGTMARCDRHGRPVESAWFALLPYPPHTIALRVRAGDTLAASVALSSTTVRLQLINRTENWSFTRTIAWGPADATSAEWIVEAPLNCVFQTCRQAALANFSALTFTEINATTGGQLGTLAHCPWTVTAVDLTPRAPDALGAASGSAAPGPLDSSGSTFTVTWSSGS